MKVFVSYAHENAEPAAAAAAYLRKAGIDPLIDVDAVGLGESFVSFMESALGFADYCLLLWSSAAAQKPWVRAEWEAALVRSVNARQVFLLTGRLDQHPLPHLLAPRLAVDLFPNLEDGLSRVLILLSADAYASSETHVPVGRPHEALTGESEGDEIYVVSELFGIAIPVPTKLQQPAAVFVERLRQELGLPSEWSFQGRIGEHFHYSLCSQDASIDSVRTLAEQGVEFGDVLTLCVERRPFAASVPVSGTQAPTVYRTGTIGDPNDRARRKAYSALKSQLVIGGMRPSAQWLS